MPTQIPDTGLDSMNRNLSSFTASGFTFPSLALCGILTVAIPAGAATMSANVIDVPTEWVFSVADATMSDAPMNTQDDDLAPRAIHATEFAHWARSMSGGDSSHMLDV